MNKGVSDQERLNFLQAVEFLKKVIDRVVLIMQNDHDLSPKQALESALKMLGIDNASLKKLFGKISELVTTLSLWFALDDNSD